MGTDKKFAWSSEVAKYLYISKSVLKEYEEKGLLQPDLVVGSGHRRYLWSNVVRFRKKYEMKEIPENAALMTVNEVHCYLGVSVQVLRQLEGSGELTPCLVVPHSGRKLYLPEDVDG